MIAPHAVVGLSFDADRLAERRKSLGASEIPAVAGLSAYKSPLDVYLEKRGLSEPFMGNAFTEWGLRFEGAIRQKYAEVVGHEVRTPGYMADPSHPWRTCTPDGIVVDSQGVEMYGLEIKRFGEYRADEFGVPGTDEVPLDVTAQCLWSMMSTQMDRWDVAVLIGQADFRIYRIDYDDIAANALHDIGYAFWHNNVLAGVQPEVDGSTSAHKYLQQKYATHTDVIIEATPELIEVGRQLAKVKAELKAIEDTKALLEHQLQAAIGGAQGIRNVATWKLNKSGRPAWKAIAEALGAKKAEHAALIERNTTPPSRMFRLLIESE